ncbi:MAG: M14 family metallopeptidase [Proteobacteria bacterium]|nr:M14 family metallopeptidase [Pseudomonadota bacterium]
MFAHTYHQARAGFEQDLASLARKLGREPIRQRTQVQSELDLSIDTAEFVPDSCQRAFVCISGTHGVEGYMGSAIQRSLMLGVLGRLDLRTAGVILVHALNPWGFHHRCRVNEDNVDLNRNFEPDGVRLYGTLSPAYDQIAAALQPGGACGPGPLADVRFAARMLAAAARRGPGAVRAAALQGQYTHPKGLFYGGSALTGEARCFSNLYEAIKDRYVEILLIDLHTGYGERGRVYALFAGADSPSLRRMTAGGIRDRYGRDKSYSARGELVAYCRTTVKRKHPDRIFNGMVLELGTHGLGLAQQLYDLRTMVLENQARLHGAIDPEAERAVKQRFSELFYPSSSAWRTQTLDAAVGTIETMLNQRTFVR